MNYQFIAHSRTSVLRRIQKNYAFDCTEGFKNFTEGSRISQVSRILFVHYRVCY